MSPSYVSVVCSAVGFAIVLFQSAPSIFLIAIRSRKAAKATADGGGPVYSDADGTATPESQRRYTTKPHTVALFVSCFAGLLLALVSSIFQSLNLRDNNSSINEVVSIWLLFGLWVGFGNLFLLI
ncbi:hypothetical protein BDY21DRAFT_106720 [Lineolata rhizophorae]|uniref:Transmembrane protein n=1 Tax=Lineolata rhizophorae TaxID=578093 RepID=A0A6A6NR39_9PEZI|nr:hypothetical protein BDY21DRAFT_106720 [Lineolata rhizophorae]